MYLSGWKGFLPVDEVHALPAGRETLQSERYMPQWLEGNPSSRPLAMGIPWDTRISARFGGKNGHPHPLAGILQRMIRDQL
jgi:hypothetical protein